MDIRNRQFRLAAFRIAFIASGILGSVIVLAWIASYVRPHQFEYATPNRNFAIVNQRGAITFMAFSPEAESEDSIVKSVGYCWPAVAALLVCAVSRMAQKARTRASQPGFPITP